MGKESRRLKEEVTAKQILEGVVRSNLEKKGLLGSHKLVPFNRTKGKLGFPKLPDFLTYQSVHSIKNNGQREFFVTFAWKVSSQERITAQLPMSKIHFVDDSNQNGRTPLVSFDFDPRKLVTESDKFLDSLLLNVRKLEDYLETDSFIKATITIPKYLQH